MYRLLLLAGKNLWGAGLRTLLTSLALSFAFVAIIWTQGLYNGMGEQATRSMIRWEVGNGQYWVENYDPYDPLSLDQAHRALTSEFLQWQKDSLATPILITPGTVYPHGRMMSVQLRGIDPGQKILVFPSAFLTGKDSAAVIIGRRMAERLGLKEGDWLTVRWRDRQGVFDATDVRIVHVFATPVSSMDNGIIWFALPILQKMMDMNNQATRVVLAPRMNAVKKIAGWRFKPQEELLRDIRELVKQKTLSALILYVILLFLALLAVYDTQVLNVFRRRKEIGTHLALGMDNKQVTLLFTLEGILEGVLAVILGFAYGAPLLSYFAVKGMPVPGYSKQFGLGIADKLYPVYGWELIVGTLGVILFFVALVSYWPARRIKKLKASDALRGKWS